MKLNNNKKRNPGKKYRNIFILFCFELQLFIQLHIMKCHHRKEKTIIFCPIDIKIDWWSHYKKG